MPLQHQEKEIKSFSPSNFYKTQEKYLEKEANFFKFQSISILNIRG